MKRLCMLAALLAPLPAAAGLPLTTAPVPPPAQEEPPAAPPCALPLPTAEEIAALPAEERERQQNTVKRVLLLRQAQAWADNNRMTAENEADSAGRAREWECPPVLADILQELADNAVGSSRRYELETALELLQERYGIDPLAVTLLVRCTGMTPETADALADALPLTHVLNRIEDTKLTTAQLAADLRVLAKVQADTAALLAEVQDPESAAAALPRMAPLLEQADSVRLTRRKLTDHEIPETALTTAAMPQYAEANQQLLEQLSRLRDAAWFDCPQLRAAAMLTE